MIPSFRPGLVFLGVAAGVLAPALSFPAGPPAWPPTTDLPNDAAVLSGRLPNGVRYAVRPNREPRDRVSIRMLVRAGSLDERDDERGYAHYLEHMAFNGTRRFPADSLVEYFQRQGMSFGGDSNASTNFEATVYSLELPHNSAATLQEGLAVLRDFADGMLLDEAEVEKERGIIFAEKRARDSVEFRTSLAEYEFLLAGTLPPRRFPIGVDETLRAANRERLRAFYAGWYRPDHIAIIAVGEIDAAEAARLIEAAFANIPAVETASTRADRGTIAPAKMPAAEIHREAEASTVAISLQTVAPYTREPDSVAARLRDLPRDVANAIINRRLERLAKQENAPFTSGAAFDATVLDFARVAGVELSGEPDRWRDSLAIADQEIRRALQYGFAPAELKEITATIINHLEEAVRAASTRRSAALAAGLVNAIDEERVFTTPETELTVIGPAVQQLTAEDCVRALRDSWSAAAPQIFVSGKIPENVTADLVLETFRASSAQPVSAPADISDEAFGYTDFGPPGAVVWREDVADLGVTLLRFANGVRVNLKRTDFQANSIAFRARVGGGLLELPPDRPELAQISGLLMNEGGLGKHDVDALNRILAGRTVRLGFGVGDDAFGFAGGTSPKDLELSLQLLCAYLVDPGLREQVLPRIRHSVRQAYERMVHTPGGIAAMRVEPLLGSGDPRFGVPPLDRVLAVTPTDVRAWLTPALSSGALEIALVGDLDVEQTIALAARTLGALPARREKPPFTEARAVRYPDAAPAAEFTVETEIPKALVLAYWPTTDGLDIPRTRRLAMLARIVDDRLRKEIRESLGAAYSPQAASEPSDTYPGFGLLSVGVEVDPPQAEKIQQTILRLAGELQGGGVSEDELERAREPALTAIRESVRQNSYWLGAVLAEAQERPEMLEAARTRLADIQAITKEELDALAARYLQNERAARFVIRPAPAGAAPGADAQPK